MRVLLQLLLGAAAALGLSSAAETPLQLTVLPESFAESFAAACLDGSPPAYWALTEGRSDTWVIFLEGGGWCFSPEGPNATVTSCTERAGGYLGTSVGLSATNVVGGLLSTDPSDNPNFYNASLVFAHYCDGASFSSAATSPVRTPSGKLLYLRGRANLRAIIAYLVQEAGLANAESVIVSGGSAGALAVYLGVDSVATWMSEAWDAAGKQAGRVVGFPDAGFFVDAVNLETGQHTYLESFQAADSVWNSSAGGGLDADCVAANAGEPWRCFLQQYAVEYVETPLFISNAAYDMWQVLNDEALLCVPSTNGQPVDGFPSCNATQLVTFGEYRSQQLQALTPALSLPGVGVWIPSCFVHEMNVAYCSTQPLPNCLGWNTYLVQNQTLAATFAAWFQSQQAGDSVTAAQYILIDPLVYPNNPSCPFPA